MNLEQIVKETVAKIVAEKKGKDLTGDGKIDSADYLQARSNAIEKAMKRESEDHEVSMAQRSLDSIIRAAMELKAKIGDQEINIPAWIQDHITNSENYIDQASQGYHEYHNGGEHEEMNEAIVSSDNVVDHLAHTLQYVWIAGKGNNPVNFQDMAQRLYSDMFGDDEMNEARFEKGEDVGGKGFEFKKIAKKAAKQYGSKEAGQRVAGAVMKKVLNKEEASTPFKQGEAANDNNQDYNTNPYEAGTEEHDLWWNGWLNAETGKQIAHDDYMLNWERGFNETRDPNSESDAPYYAVFDFHSKQPHYIIAKSASEMLSRLNGYIRDKAETNPEYKFSYDMEDLQDDYYNGKLMPHVISDDFASVTKNAEEFKKDLSYYPNAIEYKGLNEDDAMLQAIADDTSKTPAERDAARNKIYASRAKKESQELDEWTISRWQHYAGIK